MGFRNIHCCRGGVACCEGTDKNWADGTLVQWQASAACVTGRVTAAGHLNTSGTVASSAAPSVVSIPVSNALGHHNQNLSVSSVNNGGGIFGEGVRSLRPYARRWVSVTGSHGVGRLAAAVAMATGEEAEGKPPGLSDLPLLNYINQQGRIQPPVDSTTAASVFAVFDKNKKIQVTCCSMHCYFGLRMRLGPVLGKMGKMKTDYNWWHFW